MSPCHIGSDKVNFEGDCLVIHATEPMDWPIREFCKVPVVFRGRKYFLQSKRMGQPPRGMIYELAPWPAGLHEESPKQIVYDEEYVTERNRLAGAGRRHDRLYYVLVLFYPFLGLAWSGFKNRTLARCGFDPQSITSASVFLTFSLFVVEGVFVGWFRAGILAYLFHSETLVMVDWALLLFLGIDSAMRYGQLLKLDMAKHWGFCEWLWPEL